MSFEGFEAMGMSGSDTSTSGAAASKSRRRWTNCNDALALGTIWIPSH